MFTNDPQWPILYDDDIVPMKVKAKGFKFFNCTGSTEKISNKNTDSIEAIDGFWINASSAITNAEGIVTFS